MSSWAASMPVAEGEIIAGKYRIDLILGKGGMGVVVGATHLQLRQRVAIKFLAANAPPDAAARFLREARAAARLRSEHVARVIDVGELPSGAPFMVMEYLDGADLSHVVRERGQLGIEEAVEYVLHACEAITEAHAAGIVHRDLKPANLFLTTGAAGRPTVKVLDFGISKELAAEPGEEPELALTRSTAMLGSPLYMSPEQMKSSRTVDVRADVWSLGAILYELITGRVPFLALTFPELILMVNRDDPPRPSELRADVPKPLEEAILRCLEKDPARRFPSVAELAKTIAPHARTRARDSMANISWMAGKAAPVEAAPAPDANDGRSPVAMPPHPAAEGSGAFPCAPIAPASPVAPGRSALAAAHPSNPIAAHGTVVVASGQSFPSPAPSAGAAAPAGVLAHGAPPHPDALLRGGTVAMATTGAMSSISRTGEQPTARPRRSILAIAVVLIVAGGLGALALFKKISSRPDNTPANAAPAAPVEAPAPAEVVVPVAQPSSTALAPAAPPEAPSSQVSAAATGSAAPELKPGGTRSATPAPSLPQAPPAPPAGAQPEAQPTPKKSPLDVNIK
jgi:serine/threonine-protein kinase